MIEQFAKDVDLGLSKTQKTLASKYFYDKQGDALFIKIMNMPEYYLTQAEYEIFTEQSDQMIAHLEVNTNRHFELIELGAGDGTKTKKLLNALQEQGYSFDYIPIDISKNALDNLATSISKELPNVSIHPLHGDYFDCLHSLKQSDHPKIVLFLGSNIGNMPDTSANKFLKQLAQQLNCNDKLLLGVDLIKPASIVMPAYNDKSGITRAFNMNLLRRINEELDATFNLEAFEHSPEYNEEEGIAKSYLQSTRDQVVSITATKKEYQFAKGEKIHTEISRKYDDQIIHKIIAGNNLLLSAKMTDSRDYFADYIFTKK